MFPQIRAVYCSTVRSILGTDWFVPLGVKTAHLISSSLQGSNRNLFRRCRVWGVPIASCFALRESLDSAFIQPDATQEIFMMKTKELFLPVPVYPQ